MAYELDGPPAYLQVAVEQAIAEVTPQGAVVTDWVLVAASQRVDDDGRVLWQYHTRSNADLSPHGHSGLVEAITAVQPSFGGLEDVDGD